MIHKLTKVDTVRSIDSILHTPKKRVYSESELNQYDSIPKIEVGNKEETNYFSENQLKDMVEEAKKVMNGVNKQLSFRVHAGTGRDLIELIDSETKEVIREIPPERMLDILEGIWQWAGILVDRKE